MELKTRDILAKLAVKMQGNIVGKFMIKLNLVIFHWNQRKHMIHPGKEDPEKIFYVIRPRGVTEGLLSNWFNVLTQVKWAINNGYIPYVDFSVVYKKYYQYYVEREIQGTWNGWEYYFKQPYKISRKEIYRKENVILSGWSLLSGNQNTETIDIVKDLGYIESISEREYITNIVDEMERELFIDKKILGVFIRGTDYVSLKPKKHPVQPTIEQMISKIEDVLDEIDIDKIYVVTEDKDYYIRIKESFGEKVFSIYDSFIDYKEGELLQEIYTDDPYERGLHYLIRILLLARCKYFVCSNASGSLYAKLMRKNHVEYEYWFELGKY